MKNKELSHNYFMMKKIINKFLLSGEKFMPELYLKQPGLTYTAWGSFNKYWERIQKFREIGNLKHLFNK